jgi:hypothetical protein
MDLKERKHWRSRTDYEHRFTYNGFLTCSSCGEVVHTALARHDYYACKGRRTAHTCDTKYMGRERLESVLDGLFATRLSSSFFLEQCVDKLLHGSTQKNSGVEIQRLNSEINVLRRKRERVIDGFIEGVIENRERDKRLTAIDDGIRIAKDALTREAGDTPPNIESLIEAFAPLAEWEFWSRDQKRQVLSTLVPDIRVADYKVESLGVNLGLFSNEDTHRDTDSSLQRA